MANNTKKKSKKYLIRLWCESEKKYYYLTPYQDEAIRSFFGACFIWGKRTQARTYATKEQAQHELKKMKAHGTGTHAKIYCIKAQ